jgi:hypothetical protein
MKKVVKIPVQGFKNVFLCMGILFLFSCEKSLDYQLESQSAEAVTYAFPMPDSLFKIHVSYTTDILSTDSYTAIDDVKISVSVNGGEAVVKDYNADDEWMEISEVDVNEYDSVSVNINVADSLFLSAYTCVPEAISIISVDTATVLEYNDDDELEYMMRCKIKFNDLAEVSNYYQIRVDAFSVTQNDDGSEQTTLETIDYTEDDKVFISSDYESVLLSDIDYLGTFDDYLIDGSEYEVSVLIPNEYITQSNDSIQTHLIFYLYSLSSEYYFYVRSACEQEAYRDDPLYEESNVYTNVSNGLGVIGGLSLSVDTVSIRY